MVFEKALPLPRPLDRRGRHAWHRTGQRRRQPGATTTDPAAGTAREAGLLLMPSGKSRHIIRLLAPLTIEAAVLEEGLDILEECLAKLA